MNNKLNKDHLMELLAEQIGVEKDDLKEEDFLTEDLHMNPTEIADFIHLLGSEGFETSLLNLEEIETLEDLILALNLQEEI